MITASQQRSLKKIKKSFCQKHNESALTGANGFLGKHLINKLNSEGCEVYSLGRVKLKILIFFI